MGYDKIIYSTYQLYNTDVYLKQYHIYHVELNIKQVCYCRMNL